MSILILIEVSMIVSMFNHLWFKTEFFPFYCKLLKRLFPSKVYAYLLIDEYFNRQPSDYIYDSYIEYIYTKRSFSRNFLEVFLLKLLSCTLCLSTWLSIICCVYLGNILYIGVMFIFIRCADYLLNFFLKSH